MGRPSSFTQEVADEICERLALGESLIKICECDHSPSFVTVFKWLRDFPAFLNDYARARETQAERMAEQILTIADSATSEDYNAARLQVDSRKWLLSKIIPKKYGDATLLKHADPEGNKLDITVTRVNKKSG